MKKILLSAIGVVLLGAAMSAFVSVNNESKVEIMIIDNAKALAGEEEDGNYHDCWGAVIKDKGHDTYTCEKCLEQRNTSPALREDYRRCYHR
jgi:hypothetical protein